MSAFLARSYPQACARFTDKARHAEQVPQRMHRRPTDDPARRKADARITRAIALCKWGAAAMFNGSEL